MVNNTHFLRRILAVDAFGTGLMALGVIIAAAPLSDLTGMSAQWLTGVALALLPFAAWVGWLAKQSNPPRKFVWLLIAANDLWIVASFVLVLSELIPLTALGVELVVAQALLVVVIATLEFIAIRRVVSGTQSFA